MRTFLSIALGSIFLSTSLVSAADRSAQWREVDDAVSRGLPQTAIERIEPLIRAALEEKAWGEAAKGIARKIAFEGSIQGNRPEARIPRLAEEIAKAPPEIVPLLDTVQALWYWHYFQNNRFRFVQRTQTGEAPGNDFTTWDRRVHRAVGNWL